MIGFIGGGNMAEAIIRGLLSKEKVQIVVSDKNPRRLNHLKKNYGVKTKRSNREVVKAADTLLLCVKPQQMAEVLEEIAPLVSRDKLVVSIAAGIRLEMIIDALGTDRVVRVMPNTPAFVGEAMSGISPSSGVSKADVDTVVGIFERIGSVVVVDEDKMDALTALSGSGPAFVAYFIESMAEAGVRMGLTFDEALKLTLKTFSGTCSMIEQGLSPWELKRMVTSPAGTTAEGLYVMEASGLKGIIKSAIEAATERAAALSRR
ncbi:MAG: pyrroline-5-carboxylate reductase [Nitrospirae bacterium]|nr:MAG: pyrroline-5-carboxylate reductase [Nitrospirota bacterium]